MVGTVSHGQLNAGAVEARAAGVHFAVAGPEHDAAIRRLLRENPMRGAIAITFEREPDYFLGGNLAGASDCTLLAFDAGRLLCMGRATTRDLWLNGRAQRATYLGELRLDAAASGRLDILRGGYRRFRELQGERPPALFFTSIATDNHRARRLLERGLPGLPRYLPLGDLTTLLLATGRAPRPRHPLEPLSPGQLADGANAHGAQHQLAPVWTAEAIAALAGRGLAAEDCLGLRHEGRLVAAGALWDQRGFRQTVIRGYAPALRVARPLLNALGPLAGYPRLPAPGSRLAHGFLSPLALPPAESLSGAALLRDFVAAFCRRAAARGLAFLTLSLPAADPRIATLRRHFRCRAYQTGLYQVAWPGDVALTLDARPLQPDVALL